MKKKSFALQAKKSGESKEKENRIKELAGIIQEAGYQVRREQLKRGLDWKVMSGACRVGSDKLIFVDRRSPLEEQIAFLSAQVVNLGYALPSEVTSSAEHSQ